MIVLTRDKCFCEGGFDLKRCCVRRSKKGDFEDYTGDDLGIKLGSILIGLLESHNEKEDVIKYLSLVISAWNCSVLEFNGDPGLFLSNNKNEFKGLSFLSDQEWMNELAELGEFERDKIAEFSKGLEILKVLGELKESEKIKDFRQELVMGMYLIKLMIDKEAIFPEDMRVIFPKSISDDSIEVHTIDVSNKPIERMICSRAVLEDKLECPCLCNSGKVYRFCCMWSNFSACSENVDSSGKKVSDIILDLVDEFIHIEDDDLLSEYINVCVLAWNAEIDGVNERWVESYLKNLNIGDDDFLNWADFLFQAFIIEKRALYPKYKQKIVRHKFFHDELEVVLEEIPAKKPKHPARKKAKVISLHDSW